MRLSKIIAGVALAVALASPVSGKTIIKETINNHTFAVTQNRGVTAIKWCGKVYRRFRWNGKVALVSERNLTAQMLRSRKNNTLYIERIIGRVKNNRLEGKTTSGYYISYRSLKGYATTNDIICTYCVYNPYTRYIDDVIDRFDVVM